MSGPNESITQISLKEGESFDNEAILLNLEEDDIRRILNERARSAETFYEKQLNLKQVRENNEKRWLNQNFEVSDREDLYDYQLPWRDNRIFLSVETLSASVAGKIPVPVITEAFNTDASRELADNLSKILITRADKIFLKQKLQMVARHLLIGYRIGIAKYFWDFNDGQLIDGEHNGEVQVNYVRPHNVIFEADTSPNEETSIPFISETMMATLQELVVRFPKKKVELLKKFGLGENSPSEKLGKKVGYTENWFTFFDAKGEKNEGLAWKCDDIIFDAGLNPYFNYDNEKSNYFDSPQKPYVIFNFLQLGRWIYDDSSLTEQAASQQDNLEKRGQQIVDNADQVQASRVFNTLMITQGEIDKYISDPKQNIMVKGPVNEAFARITAPNLPSYVMKDKEDARAEIDNIFGTHAPLRGESTASPTLGQEVMSQRSDLGRTVPLIDSMEKGATRVYEGMVQLYKVFATEEHIAKYTGLAGETTFIAFINDQIEDGVEIKIQPGSMKPDDKTADKNEAMELAKIGNRIDPLTFAEKWHLANPKEFAKRLVSFLWTPDRYMKDVLGVDLQAGPDQNAMDTIQRINAGESVPPKENASKEYLAQYEAFIRSPGFKQLDPEVRQLHVVHLRETIQLSKQSLAGGQPSTSAPTANSAGAVSTPPGGAVGNFVQNLVQKMRGGAKPTS